MVFDSDIQLVENFIASFGAFDDMIVFDEFNSAAWNLRLGKAGRMGVHWRPRKVKTSPRFLDPVYQKLPIKFPALYEKLVLSYRWAEIDVGTFRLIANPTGPGLIRFEAELFSDEFLVQFALSNGYLRFAKGPDMNYDPVCFDISRDTGSHEFPIVRLDHEAILCNEVIEVAEEMAPNFRSLMITAVEAARQQRGVS